MSVEYTQDTVTETQHATNFVQFCVGVQRACGLQYAAQRALKAGAPLEHAATVGVDSYVAVSYYVGIFIVTDITIDSKIRHLMAPNIF